MKVSEVDALAEACENEWWASLTEEVKRSLDTEVFIGFQAGFKAAYKRVREVEAAFDREVKAREALLDRALQAQVRAERVEAALRSVIKNCDSTDNDLNSDLTVSRAIINEAAAVLIPIPGEATEDHPRHG